MKRWVGVGLFCLLWFFPALVTAQGIKMNRRIRTGVVFSIVLALLFLSGTTWVEAQPKTIILATTTSTQDSGLLDVLLPIFEKKTGYFVKTIAVGSGQAMAMGQ